MATNEDVELTPDEEWRVYAFSLRLLNTWLAIETAYINGLIPQATFDAVENDIRAMMNRFPHMHPQCQLVSEAYPALSEMDIFQTLDTILDEYEQ